MYGFSPMLCLVLERGVEVLDVMLCCLLDFESVLIEKERREGLVLGAGGGGCNSAHRFGNGGLVVDISHLDYNAK